jgi:iron complex transport system substrate-binding protein
MLLAAIGLGTGCDNRGAAKPPTTQALTVVNRTAGTAPAQKATSSGTQATQSSGWTGPSDCVIAPDIDPAERNAGPKRIISMAPSLTELCWALGLGDRMVGRTQYCLYPPAVKGVEVVGALLDPNVERIMTLQPDLLLVTSGSGMLQEKFTALHMPVRTLPADSLEDIFTAIQQLGEATGRPKSAARLAGHLRADLENLHNRATRAMAGTSYKVLFVTGALPSPARSVWVAGPGSYLDQLLSLAGAHNAVAGNRPWLEIGTEQVLWLRPDVIIEVREPAQANLRDDAVTTWRALPGLTEVRIVTVSDIGVVFPGPRVNVMLGKMIDGLYGTGEAQGSDGEPITGAYAH